MGAGRMSTRRFLLVGVGTAGLLAAVPVFAQQSPKASRIGVLWHGGSAEEEATPLGGLVEGFKDLGYIDGQNIILEHRFPSEEAERFFPLAEELAQAKVDVLIAVTRQAAIAAQKATKTIPTVFI